MKKFFKKIFGGTKRADKIADCRMKYFDKFIGFYVDEVKRWHNYGPEEAMREADKVVAWVYPDGED